MIKVNGYKLLTNVPKPVYKSFLYIIVVFLILSILSIIANGSVGASYRKFRSFFVPQLTKDIIESIKTRDVILKPFNVSCHNLAFFITVQVAADNVKSRNWYRNNIGIHKLKYNFDMMFSIGMPSNSSSQKKIREENHRFGDILQTDFLDTYHNLTLKQLAQMRYIDSACKNIDIILKIDDDIVFSLERINKFVTSIKQLKKLDLEFWRDRSSTNSEIFCCMFKNSPVIHDLHYKWSVTNRFSQTTWPDFCSGSGYFITLPAIRGILANVENFDYIWLDDVYLTGFVAPSAGVQLVDIMSHCYLEPSLPRYLENGKVLLSMVDSNRIDEFFVSIQKETNI